MIGIKTILLPTDGSECSRKAMAYSLSFAKQYGARIVALHVIDRRWEPVVRWEQYAAAVEEAPPLAVRARGRALRTFRIYRLHDLQPRTSCPTP